MEFKATISLTTGILTFILIEPKWNLKAFKTNGLKDVRIILIEPKWNLKDFDCSSFVITVFKLIEPKWNLKLTNTGYVRREFKY